MSAAKPDTLRNAFQFFSRGVSGPMPVDDDRAQFERDGRIRWRGLLSGEDVAAFDGVVQTAARPGRRLTRDACGDQMLAASGRLLQTIDAVFGPMTIARVVAFNKTEVNNWGLPWHQDRIIAVNGRQAHPGFCNWTIKSGVWHCEPPRQVLEAMLFVRVHLDDCESASGPMRIALGSHKLGVVPSAQARAAAEALPIEDCIAKRGDVLVLKMLTLHSSQPSHMARTRRVLRIDFAPAQGLLPAPLQWQAALASPQLG